MCAIKVLILTREYIFPAAFYLPKAMQQNLAWLIFHSPIAIQSIGV
jgi:hypothetical protein